MLREAKRRALDLAQSEVPQGDPSHETPSESPLFRRVLSGQTVYYLPISCAVLSIYALPSAVAPRLPLIVPTAGTRLHAALLRYLPRLISDLRRHRRRLDNDGTRFAP